MPNMTTNTDLSPIYSALRQAGREIYGALKLGHGLSLAGVTNETGDDQIGLDIFADNAFVDALSTADGVKSIMSEERPDIITVGKGRFSVALDPLDGSKSALYGVPCGAIFGIFDGISNPDDFHGQNIIASGFFVFGINLELYFADATGVYFATWSDTDAQWGDPIRLEPMPSANVFAVNVSGINFWNAGLRAHYLQLHNPKPPAAPPKGRWFASLVLDVKRLAMQGGVFAYPANTQQNYTHGHLRLVYEGIPMAFFVQALGGESSDGTQSLLSKKPTDLHEKTPVFLGETKKIAAIERAITHS